MTTPSASRRFSMLSSPPGPLSTKTKLTEYRPTLKAPIAGAASSTRTPSDNGPAWNRKPLIARANPAAVRVAASPRSESDAASANSLRTRLRAANSLSPARGVASMLSSSSVGYVYGPRTAALTAHRLKRPAPVGLRVITKSFAAAQANPSAADQSGEGGIRTLDGGFPPYSLSRRVPSATRPPLRERVDGSRAGWGPASRSDQDALEAQQV